MFTVIGIISTVVLARLALRAIRYRFGQRFGHREGGCGGFRRHAWHHRHRHGAFDLGDIGVSDHDDYRRWSRHRAAGPQSDFRARDILSGLELNARQTAEAADVLVVLRSAGVSQLMLALRASSRPTFDADLAAAAIGPHPSRDALDALEHLHTILTDEQRAELDRLTART